MSDDKKKLSKAEALKGMWVDLEAERLQKEAESMTEEELIEREKAVGAHEAMNDAFANVHKMIDEAKREEPKTKSNVVDIGIARRAKAKLATTVGVLSFLTGGGIIPIYMAANNIPLAALNSPVATPIFTAAASQAEERAHKLREKAYDECFKGQYAQCLQDLDEAQGLDPAGNDTPTAMSARKFATEASRPQ